MQTLTFFFFQAEDGIRDLTVTGVQTCALPIYILPLFEATQPLDPRPRHAVEQARAWTRGEIMMTQARSAARSEERRVGKECRYRWSPYHQKKSKHQARAQPTAMLLAAALCKSA